MKKTLLEGKKVAIIGGGPGGLTLARLLQLKGAEVRVYERDFNRAVRVQGATLDLHFGSGLKAIEAAGLAAEFGAAYRPGAEKGRVLDKQARILYDEHGAEAVTAPDAESFRPEIDRSDLRDLLLDSLAPGTLVWDRHLTGVSRDEKWKLEFSNGTTATADMVIGADGANSKIRLLLTPVRPFYAGITILQGNVADAETAAPGMHRLLKGGKTYTHSDGKYLHVSAKGDGSIDFYISMEVDENWAQRNRAVFSDRPQLLAWVRDAFAGWNEVWFGLFEQAGLPLLVRPQYCVPSGQRWTAQPDITLLGDAAHIMPPSGEGVNLAMLDALELSECLTGGSCEDLRSAIAAYEERMLARAAQEAELSMEMAGWMHGEGAQEKLIALFNQLSGS